MKRKIFINALLFLASSSFASTTITRNHGGPNGYDKVTESHTGVIFKDNTLSCIDPGNSDCKWLVAPSSVRNPKTGRDYEFNVLAIESYVREKITNGQLSGKMLDASGNVLTVWTAKDAENYQLVIDYNFIQFGMKSF